MKYQSEFFRRFGFFALGAGACWLGIRIFKDAWSYLYGFPVPKFAGILLASFGIVLILYSIFAKNFPKGYDDHFVICSECKSSFYEKDVTDQTCPKCNGKTEEMDGFYKRHPDKR